MTSMVSGRPTAASGTGTRSPAVPGWKTRPFPSARARLRVEEGAPPLAEDARRHRPGFLADKLQMPQPSFPILHRPRVSALLDEATAQRVTLVSGPAGAGKTLACASWAAARPAAGRVVWLTVDANDRRDWFWAYVCAALNRARPAPAETLRGLEDCSADRFPLHLVEAAQAFTDPVVLVLDDIHLLADPSVLGGLDVLIRHAPPALRLVMLARRPPALQLARLRVAGELADIEGADLACTAQEADAYFEMLGMNVLAAERDEVLGRTEGWMAGLRLTAMKAGPRAADSGNAAPLARDEPLVTEYLWDEVLAEQDPEVRSFLVRTSVVAELTGDLADTLTGGTGSTSVLAKLSRENTFVSAACGRTDSYRYHPLLREVLNAELHREFSHEIPVLLGRAARWHASHDRPLDAVRCTAAAGDWDAASQALTESGIGAVMSAGPAELESVLSLFPAQRVAGDVAVALAGASARLWSGDPEGAADWLANASKALGQAPRAVREVAEPTLAALRIMHVAEQAGGGDPGRLFELIRSGRSLADSAQASGITLAGHRGLGLLWFALGSASLRRWETGEARHALMQADRELGAGGLAGLRARARAWLALTQAWHGDLTLARQTAGAVGGGAVGGGPVTGGPVSRSPDGGGPVSRSPDGGGPVSRGRVSAIREACVLAALACAEISLAQDDLVTAQRLAGEADHTRAGHVPGEPPVAVIAELVRARILLADGNLSAGRSVLSGLRETCVPACPPLSRAVTVAEAEAVLRAGDTGRARALLLQAGESGPGGHDGVPGRGGDDGVPGRGGDDGVPGRGEDDGVPGRGEDVPGGEGRGTGRDVAGPCLGGDSRGRGDAVLAWAGVMLAEGDFAGALEAVGPLLGGSMPVTGSERIRALMAAGIAHRRLGDSRRATELVEKALSLAEPEGAYRVFLDAGPAARSALIVLVPPTSRHAGFAGRTLERFETHGPRLAVCDGASAGLTGSERAVLCFLPSHMTNEEIAQALFLSVNTVKTHLRWAYRKLGVGSRREAIARARQLGLLLSRSRTVPRTGQDPLHLRRWCGPAAGGVVGH